MQIRELDTQKRGDVKQFVDFPYELYRTCEQWGPPLTSSIRLALDRRRHPFYRHSDAAFFLAEQEGRTLGRIAVLENRRYNAYNQSRAAFFYLFDSVDDIAVSNALFEAAADWARARELDTLLGPKGMLRSDAVGILIDGFEHPTAMSMPYNYPYYARLLETAGFVKEVDYMSGYMTRQNEFPERFNRMVDRIKERSGFWVKSFNHKRELQPWIPKIQQVNNEAFTEVWGYYPIDDAEVQMIGKQLLAVADPRLIKIVMQGEDIAGFAFIFPDIAEALRKTQGRLWPLGWIHILFALRNTQRLLANGVGLLPKYQGLGATTVLYTEFAKTLYASNAQFCEFAQVLESNIKSLGDMNALGVRWHKQYRIYRLALTGRAVSSA